MTLPTLADVEAAAARLRPYVVRTPLERSTHLSERCGAEVWLKFECFQTTGSFKLRGALNALLQLPPGTPVLTVSAGNHGLGVARAAALLHMAATVIVPETASSAKIEALRDSGAELLLRGRNYDEAEACGRQLANDAGAEFVSAYNDAAVVAGGGTVALEILEDLPSTRTLIVPAGGGGLIGGVGIAAHGLQSSVVLYGAQSVASPALHAALEARQRVDVPIADSLADGLAGNVEDGSITLDLLRHHVRQVVLVEEHEIAAAMRFLIEREHVVVEGAAAVGVAALLRQAVELDTSGATVVVLTGRNVAASVLQQYVFAQ